MSYDFEIGVSYKNKYGRYYLAVDKDVLVTFVCGDIVECQNLTGKYSVARNISVEKLCNIWEITLDDLDVMSEIYFAPTRLEGTRRRLPDKYNVKDDYKQETINKFWAIHRTHRIQTNQI
jgi:hypothetical protein